MKALTTCLSSLSEETKTIESHFALLRCGKQKNVERASCIEAIRTSLATAEAELIRLKTLQPDNEAVVRYEAKLKEWRRALLKAESRSAATPLNRAMKWLDSLDQAARREEAQEAASEERRLRPILGIRLDESDPQALAKTLLDLSIRIEPKAGFNSWNDKQYSALKAKFDSGLLLLRAADPTHPLLSGLEAKQRAWKTRRRRSIVLVIAGILGLLIISAILSYFEK